MSELTLTLLRLGFVGLLWALVLSIVAVLRRDLFGTVVRRRDTPVKPGSGRVKSRTRSSPRQVKSAPPGTPPGGIPGSSVPTELVVTGGSLKGTTLAMKQAPILIGRAPECTLVLEDDYASNRHAQLSLQNGVWMLEDLGSTNGTFVGRNALEAPVPVTAGSSFRIGRTTLELRR